jgi:predicted site-specific integrase-resolvase
MLKRVIMTKLRVNQFASRIGKSPSTVRRWDREGTIPAKRTASGERYYDESDIKKALGIEVADKKVVVYCRVSSTNQKDDLASQVKAMEQFCLGAGIAVDEWIEDLLTIVHSFSSRLYGLRKHKKILS